MILDLLENADNYTSLNPGFAKAFEFLSRPDLADLPEGKHEIDGDRLYAMVVKAPGRSKEEALLEAHKEYIDIQLVLAGTDEMGWKPLSACITPQGDHDPETDARLFSDPSDASVATGPGAFAIFFPQDAHAPNISSGDLHKVVAKVAINQDR